MPKLSQRLKQNGRTIYAPDATGALIPLTATPGRHSDGGGLYYVVSPTGHRWAFLYKSRTRKLKKSGLPAPVEMGIGGAPDGTDTKEAVSLANARRRAADHRATLQQGLDPLEEKRKPKATAAPVASDAAPVADPDEKNITFGEYADKYYEQRKNSWKGKAGPRQWFKSLTIEAADLRPLRIRDITTDHVLGVVRPVFEKTPETGSRLRARIHAVLAAATVDKYRPDAPNPARWKGHLDQTTLPKKAKARSHPALPYKDMPAFMGELRQRNSLSALALRFTIGTVARTAEITGAMWSEINFDAKLWTVPAIRMKAEKEHRVPLTDSMVALLEVVRRISHGDYIFAIGHSAPLSNAAMSELLKGMRPPAVATVHGFRSSFTDWAEDEDTDIDHQIVEFCKAHVVGNKAEAAYRRGTALTKRRKALEQWGKYLGG